MLTMLRYVRDFFRIFLKCFLFFIFFRKYREHAPGHQNAALRFSILSCIFITREMHSRHELPQRVTYNRTCYVNRYVPIHYELRLLLE